MLKDNVGVLGVSDGAAALTPPGCVGGKAESKAFIGLTLTRHSALPAQTRENGIQEEPIAVLFW